MAKMSPTQSLSRTESNQEEFCIYDHLKLFNEVSNNKIKFMKFVKLFIGHVVKKMCI
jgi:hypothetical protein